jgi:hypothetical protein
MIAVRYPKQLVMFDYSFYYHYFIVATLRVAAALVATTYVTTSVTIIVSISIATIDIAYYYYYYYYCSCCRLGFTIYLMRLRALVITHGCKYAEHVDAQTTSILHNGTCRHVHEHVSA